ncbi:hypothetical protein IQ218_14080 [Synechocystis salina LEGE 06099]|nr:hypothetical protein [Synechocystis salina]MBE9204361.1 hypothetical protein [Synechocystis salina LEGE 06099]
MDSIDPIGESHARPSRQKEDEVGPNLRQWLFALLWTALKQMLRSAHLTL